MNVLIINGSPRVGGNTSVAVDELVKTFAEEGVETHVEQIGMRDIRGCVACNRCRELKRCVFDDAVNEIAPLFDAADGLVVASPVYYASANATTIAFLDRLFFSAPVDKRMKVGAAVAVARRGGATTTFDELNKYFLISGMPVAGGQYWNAVHGMAPGEASEDAEGLQQMRALARAMTFLMKSIALGRETFGLPAYERIVRTNFVR